MWNLYTFVVYLTHYTTVWVCYTHSVSISFPFVNGYIFHLFERPLQLHVSTQRMSRACSKCNQKPSREPDNDYEFLKGVKIRRFCTANILYPFIDTVIYTVNILDTMLLCTRERTSVEGLEYYEYFNINDLKKYR